MKNKIIILTQQFKKWQNNPIKLGYCFLMVSMFFSVNLMATEVLTSVDQDQKRTVTGLVVDERGEPVIGANVIEVGTTNGTITDFNGNFSLSVSPNATLKVSYIGHIDNEILVGNNSTLNIVLKEDTHTLDDVVVVGYGSQKKVSLTSSVGVIKSENINQFANNTVSALQGLAPGLAIVDKGGAPGRTNTMMRVRGITSLNDNNNGALLLVDGIEQRIEDLNPDDIESISILKDASATSIYGSRAANGVILITTKRAKTGKATVNYSYYYGIQKATNKPKQMDTETYMRQQNVVYENAGFEKPWPEEKIKEWLSSKDKYKHPAPNEWFDTLLSTAPQQNHSLTVSGGNEIIKGVASLRYFDQGGIIPNFNSDIKEMRVNTDFQVNPKLKVSLDANYRVRYSRAPREESDIYYYMVHASQFTVPRYEDGSYGLSSQGKSPLVSAELSGNNRRWQNLLVGNFKVEYDIFKDLKASIQYALQQSNTKEKNFTNQYKVVDKYNNNVSKNRDRNDLFESRDDFTETTLNILLQYNKSIKRHHINLLAGYSVIQNKHSFLDARRQDFYNNELTSINMGSESTMKNSGYDNKWALQSYFGRANYNYSDKYLFEANIRYDGSSRFTGDNQYSFFPSFSAGWRISNENFWEKVSDIIPSFKIRGSWGKTGNQSVDLYSYYDAYSVQKYSFNGEVVNGYRQKTLSNKDLKWESTRQFDIGFDAGLLDNRLTAEFSYYNKRTDGILIALPIPDVVGLDAPFQNAAIVDNKGFELTIGYRGGTTFTYNVNFNISNNKNKVISMAGASPIITGPSYEVVRIKDVGYPINGLWGYKTDGLYQTEEEIKKSPLYDPNTKPGDVKYLDINNDGVINANDRTYLGDEYPHYPFAISGNFGYKGFDLSILFQGVIDAQTRVSGPLAEFGNYEALTLDLHKDYWTPENPGASIPRPQRSCDYNSAMSDFWIIDAGYIRLKNLELGYSVPKHILSRINIERLRFYVGGTNLFTISNMNKWGLDAEFPSGRFGHYPQTSVYTFGVNISF